MLLLALKNLPRGGRGMKSSLRLMIAFGGISEFVGVWQKIICKKEWSAFGGLCAKEEVKRTETPMETLMRKRMMNKSRPIAFSEFGLILPNYAMLQSMLSRVEKKSEF
jgi:hypothetical protein